MLLTVRDTGIQFSKEFFFLSCLQSLHAYVNLLNLPASLGESGLPWELYQALQCLSGGHRGDSIKILSMIEILHLVWIIHIQEKLNQARRSANIVGRFFGRVGPARHGSFCLMKWDLRGDHTSDNKMWGEEKKYLHAWHVSSINKYRLAMSNLGLEMRRFLSTWKKEIIKKIRDTEWIKDRRCCIYRK